MTINKYLIQAPIQYSQCTIFIQFSIHTTLGNPKEFYPRNFLFLRCLVEKKNIFRFFNSKQNLWQNEYLISKASTKLWELFFKKNKKDSTIWVFWNEINEYFMTFHHSYGPRWFISSEKYSPVWFSDPWLKSRNFGINATVLSLSIIKIQLQWNEYWKSWIFEIEASFYVNSCRNGWSYSYSMTSRASLS